MLIFRRCINVLVLPLLLNGTIVLGMFNTMWPIWVAVLLLLSCYYIFLIVRPRGGTLPEKRLKTLFNGFELVLTAEILVSVEIILYVCTVFLPFMPSNIVLHIINVVLCFLLLWILALSGSIRLFITSSQMGSALRISLMLLWWVPVLNYVLLYKAFRILREELSISVMKHQRNLDRKGTGYCSTQYPLVLIHGIFFRDWKLVNYWGRIPDALAQHEAVLFYGNQQSSASLAGSAAELKQRVQEVLKETGAEKVNIIAHSKGGLDARYAISCLGMGQYVASLTTINTPHRGSVLADKLIQIAPDKFILAVGRNYDKLYAKLGDNQPDFFSGVSDLTEEKCQALNEIMPDDPNVYYQSVASKMRTRFSAPFPLNAGYSIIKPLRGDNDGLVATDSMAWGHFLGVFSAIGKRGISHADIVDLWRKDVSGFDVCELYVNLVHQLKEQGL